MGALRGASEIPLLLTLFYLFHEPGSLAGEPARRFWTEARRRARRATRVEDIVRWGVWLGRHICQKITQVS